MEPDHKANSRLPWIVVPIVIALAILSALGLTYVRPNLFQFINTFPATLTYFGLFAWLILAGRTHVKEAKRKNSERSIPNSDTGASQGSFLLAEFGLFAFLTLLSATIGAFSGVVWWGAGGHITHSLLGATCVGAVIGALMVVFLLAGP
jgi:hypothetical protein